uniref:C1q-domain-containing protein n=1 Tax=Mytilus galloprovincialis TaxID=29158 RepID=E1UJ66_MYTGA|nr:C1q-domain-containing protein [Mytilus galloprovincialis]CBH31056.1 C1q-domain-containing protein [Mytilus galloprovincialis]
MRMNVNWISVLTVMVLVSKSTCLIAFSAYMSESKAGQSNSIIDGSTLIFDKVEINSGSDYSVFTGKFSVPSSGIYAFTWTICVDSRYTNPPGRLNYGEYGTELMMGSTKIGVLHTDTETKYDDACSTGFVIRYVSSGNQVYVRNNYAHQGKLLSKESQTRTTFSGWKMQ